MRDEIKQLRGLLENQLAHLAWGDLNHREPLHAGVMRRLSSMELDTALIERVSARTASARDDEHAWQLALSELSASVPVGGATLADVVVCAFGAMPVSARAPVGVVIV